MMFKYVGANKANKRVSGLIQAESQEDALAKIKETTDIIVITQLKETIDNQLINAARQQISNVSYQINSAIVDQREKAELSKLQKERERVEKQRKELYNPDPPQESFKAIREAWGSVQKRIDNIQLFKPKPPIQDEETVLDKEAYYELLDMFKERENEFDNLSMVEVGTVEQQEKNEAEVDWDLIEPHEESKVETEKLFKVRVKEDVIIMLTRRLQIMINAGVSLVNALMILSDDDDEAMRMMLEKIIEDIQMGHSFSSAISKFPAQFDNTYVSLVQIGETSGNMAGSLLDVIDNMEQKIAIKKQLRSAAIYPTIIGIVLAVVVVLASIFFIPAFEEIIMDVAGDDGLPLITEIVFTASDYIPLVAGILVGAVLLFNFVKSRNRSLDRRWRELTSRLSLTLPVLGTVISIYQMNNFASTVGLMLRNGVRLSESLILAQQSSNNVFIKSEIANASLMMINGFSLSEGLAKQPHFDKILVNIILIGEETGEMSFALDEIAKYYEGELERRIEDLMGMVQPLSILLIGIIAVPAIIAIYLPILNMSSGM